MPDPIQLVDRLLPVQIAPRAGEIEGGLDAVFGLCLVGLRLIGEVPDDILPVFSCRDATERLVAANHQAHRTCCLHRIHHHCLLDNA